MIVLSESDVRSLLDRDELIETMGSALAELSAGTASVPPRVAATVAQHSAAQHSAAQHSAAQHSAAQHSAAQHSALLLAMPGHLRDGEVLGAKLVSLFPDNVSLGKPSHHAVVILFDPQTGVPEALLAATLLTAERTAAVSALATRLLARPGVKVMAILGTGIQARAHALTVPRALASLEEIRIAGRDRGRATALADELGPHSDVPVRVSSGFAQALSGADVVCATTNSRDPVVRLEWLSPGTHVNSVGFNVEGREVDAATVASAFVAVESRVSALAPPPAGSNDLLWPIRDGLIESEHVSVELGELVLGLHPGRTSSDQLTLFKSVGVAVEDLAAASLVVTAARVRGLGQSVEL